MANNLTGRRNQAPNQETDIDLRLEIDGPVITTLMFRYHFWAICLLFLRYIVSVIFN